MTTPKNKNGTSDPATLKWECAFCGETGPGVPPAQCPDCEDGSYGMGMALHKHSLPLLLAGVETLYRKAAEVIDILGYDGTIDFSETFTPEDSFTVEDIDYTENCYTSREEIPARLLLCTTKEIKAYAAQKKMDEQAEYLRLKASRDEQQRRRQEVRDRSQLAILQAKYGSTP